MLRHDKKPMTAEMPLYGYAYDTRADLIKQARYYGLNPYVLLHGSDEVLHMSGDAGKFKDMFDQLEKVKHSSGGVR